MDRSGGYAAHAPVWRADIHHMIHRSCRLSIVWLAMKRPPVYSHLVKPGGCPLKITIALIPLTFIGTEALNHKYMGGTIAIPGNVKILRLEQRS
jgi:hypothetical protein